MPKTVMWELENGVAKITLNRPDRLNAVNIELIDELGECIEKAKSDEVRVVVLTGTGRAFSSGADLKEIGTFMASDTGEIRPSGFLRDKYHPVFRAITTLEKPVIAAVNGVAAGVSCSLALSCDLVWAKQSAYFLLPFARIGLVPDGGSNALVPALIGRILAMEFAMLADRMEADRAAEIGLINRAVPDDEFEREVDALAVKLASGATVSFASAKKAINLATLDRLDEILEFEADLQDKCSATADFGEGLAAFIEKRDPKFQGK